jgi:hypothetical protein
MSKDDGDTVINTAPEPTLAGAVGEFKFKIKVFLNGIEQGWFTDVDDYIVVTPNQADGTTWTQVNYGGKTYFKKSTNNYMSVASPFTFSMVMCMRHWVNAAPWQLVGKNLALPKNEEFKEGLVGRGVEGPNSSEHGDRFYVHERPPGAPVEVEFVKVV